MLQFFLYFNELSAPPTDISEGSDQQWKMWALMLFTCLRQVNLHRSTLNIAWPSVHWDAMCGGKPLSVWMKKWLERDQYRWIIMKRRNVSILADPCAEVYFNDQKAIGFTLSTLGESWAFSFPISNSCWLTSSLIATQYRLNSQDVVEQTCTIKNLAIKAHVDDWRQDLVDWGRKVVADNTIGILAGHRITMYPKDHGYPHVHLIESQQFNASGRPVTLAKYRVDHFCRMEGKPCWDKKMQDWIEKHRDELLASWDRCQSGGHPFLITKDG